ncbi:myrcene synthase, chloroplastic-like [Carica papaya]|uniref:myrcene synthase, chloroplastic-like n=1 Tax=Carica papaya TaxID=3649 RepID=UPI000B8C6FF5|nr:myrcene synthase, chloroplastic-like [Carica papaya]
MAIHSLIQGLIPSSFFFMNSRPENCNLIKNGVCVDPFRVRCKLAAGGSEIPMHQQSIPRRSANYEPPLWSYDYIQSLTNDYLEESYGIQLRKLKAQVSTMLELLEDPLDSIELIDILERLGLSYHFTNDIDKILKCISEKNKTNNDSWKKNNLYATALEFRLLRQHGYHIPQEIFNIFMDEKRSFKAHLNEDIKGILSLYEASYLLVEGEIILEEARSFTTKHLKEYIKQNKNDLSVFVSHALELPLHWRVPRVEARWFIEYYERKQDMSPILLKFAKLDFNIVQAIYKKDLKQESRWWKNIGFEDKLVFSRSRLVESFLWSIGITFKTQLGYYRQMVTKVISLVTTIDDIYDVYGTLNELELFTDTVKRWDIHTIDQLPEYMQICFLGLYNSINEISFGILKEYGTNVIPHLREAVSI